MNAFVNVAVPPGVVTLMLTVPEPAGDVAVTDVEVVAVIEPVLLPNLTKVAPERLVPLIVTLVPPVLGPEVGETDPNVGAAPVTLMVTVIGR
nr:hypothetical protein [Jeongeupia chitinilytica]